MKKYSGVFWIIGLCAFVALMCSGFLWIIDLINKIPNVNIHLGFLSQIKNIAHLILIAIALVSGWIWLLTTNMNKTLKVVLKVFFIVFAVLAVLGVYGVGI